MSARGRLYCVTDVGSTTTKAVLFFRGGDSGGWRYLRHEAATTVEKPDEDVTVGVMRALDAFGDEVGTPLTRDGRPAVKYLSTSSAGGGLAVVVTGLVRAISSQSAERVALGAGAIVLDVLALDDGRTPYRKIRDLERLRPDMVLLAGGFDGDAISGPVFLAEILNEAALHPKRNPLARLPVVYAGNRNALPYVQAAVKDRFMLRPVDNLRPEAGRELLGPAREAIHELFMEHVMSQAPGYERLREWVDGPLLPTPSAFGTILGLVSGKTGERILAVDVGGATTDVFTAHRGRVVRTVSANLGMSYSILHVLRTAGLDALLDLLDEGGHARAVGHPDGRYVDEVLNRIGEKYLNPTRLPSDEFDAEIERGIATLAVREAVRAHLRVLSGRSDDRGEDALRVRSLIRDGSDEPDHAAQHHRRLDPVHADRYDLIIGSGGALSHSPRGTAARMLTDALHTSRKAELAVDSAFIFPHLGVLSTQDPDLAVELFHSVGLLRLGRASDHRGSTARSVVPGASSRIPARAGQPVRRGELLFRRELSIPGEVLVQTGDVVSIDTLIARSTRLFLRPFFLPVAQVLECRPGETEEYLLKKPGDEFAPGDLLARRKGKLRTREFRCQVGGTFDRLLADGTVLARETPAQARHVCVVNAAGDLGIDAGKLAPCVRCHIGQEVDAGSILAATGIPPVGRASRSPIRGRVTEIRLDEGRIRVEPLREELEVLAWVPGTVREVTDRGAVVAARAVEITGVWGIGGETCGTSGCADVSGVSGAGVACDSAGGAIAVRGHLDLAELRRLCDAGVAGVIAAGADLGPLIAESWPFTVVVLEGFGRHDLRGEFAEIMRRAEGRTVHIDGTTELRVGVRRPRVLIIDV